MKLKENKVTFKKITVKKTYKSSLTHLDYVIYVYGVKPILPFSNNDIIINAS